MARQRVLWIEDSAYSENTSLAPPVYLSGRYDLHIALTATDGMNEVLRHDYEAVVVDIRIPPGDDRRWIEIYYRNSENHKTARLGLRLLEVILGPPEKGWPGSIPERAGDPSRYGVLSVEGIDSLKRHLDRLKVRVYRDKGSGEAPDTLLNMFDEIARQRRDPPARH